MRSSCCVHRTCLFFLLIVCTASAQRIQPDAADVTYASVGGVDLLLDVYLPKNAPKPYPVVLWVHGGAWRGGSKENANGTFLLSEGFALVSINYRLSNQALFPAQIHDCKGAVRWIRANAGMYGFDGSRIGAFGSSAGGHLVAMLGTAGDIAGLEGNVGGNLGYSSSVQGVCDWYGPADLVTIGDYPSGLNHRNASSPEGELIGGAILENLEKARAASPIVYVTGDDPPFLIQHGTQDNTVPFHQSVELDSALRLAGTDVTFIPIVGGTHGGGFNVDSVRGRVVEFFTRVLKSGTEAAVDDNGRNAAPHLTIEPRVVQGTYTIQITLPRQDLVWVETFDMLGRRISRDDLGLLEAGTHQRTLPEASRMLIGFPSGTCLFRAVGRSGTVAAPLRVVR